MNYINGKIYKITDIAYTKMYIGSTTQSLAKRFSFHKCGYKRWQDGKFNKLTVFDIFNEFGIENCKIELIENFECNSKEELERKEGEHIKDSECVNKRIEGRTNKQWREDNKQHISEQHKVFYQDHKQQISENKSQRIQCICGAQYSKGNKSHHFKTKNHINKTKNIQ